MSDIMQYRAWWEGKYFLVFSMTSDELLLVTIGSIEAKEYGFKKATEDEIRKYMPKIFHFLFELNPKERTFFFRWIKKDEITHLAEQYPRFEWNDVTFFATDLKDDRILLNTESKLKSQEFGLSDIGNGLFGKWVLKNEVKFMGWGWKVNLAKWKGEYFHLSGGGRKEDGKLRIFTFNVLKAERCGMPTPDRDGYSGIWVPAEEVEIIGNTDRLWKIENFI